MKILSMNSEEISCPTPKSRQRKIKKSAMKTVNKKRNGHQKPAIEIITNQGSKELQPLENLLSDNASDIPNENKSGNNTEARKEAKASPFISDQLVLDTVRDQVYQKLLDGEINLDIGACFKAIEIKHKIAEESQNEKLLLEILNEIRSEELANKKIEIP
jgi:hypothetical protein